MAFAYPSPDGADLLPWPDVQQRQEWTGLLAGNGASIAFWRDFDYSSLYERARSDEARNGLTVEDIAVFEAFGTTNFEEVLSALKTTRLTLEALQHDANEVRTRYGSIQRALFEAVRASHVPWGLGPTFDRNLRRIREVMREHSHVYTINYDLILYWAAMAGDPKYEIVDFFWPEGRHFDPLDTTPPGYVPADATRLLFVHGALHLRHHISGATFKLQAGGKNLLDQFETSAAGTEVPLLVSEGDGASKRRAIERSAYLSFALEQLSEHDGALVIFGCSLRHEDSHLVDAIRRAKPPALAFSVRPSQDEAAIVQRKAQVRDSFPETDLYFYDSTTHRLGESSMQVGRRWPPRLWAR